MRGYRRRGGIAPAPAPPPVPVTVSGLARTTPHQVRVTLSDGRTEDVVSHGGSGWRLGDAGVDLTDPTLRLDGAIVP